jgi:hypothetical protein
MIHIFERLTPSIIIGATPSPGGHSQDRDLVVRPCQFVLYRRVQSGVALQSARLFVCVTSRSRDLEEPVLQSNRSLQGNPPVAVQ